MNESDNNIAHKWSIGVLIILLSLVLGPKIWASSEGTDTQRLPETITKLNF